MQPQQPQAPTPGQYDFILNTGNQPAPKKFGLSPDSSFMKKFLVLGGGAVGLLLVIVLALSIFGGSGKSSPILLTVAQEQTEIIRISNFVLTEKAIRDNKTIEFGNTTLLSVTSSQSDVLAILSKSGKKYKPKDFALKQNAQTDAKLSAAAKNNTYDEAFMTALKAELTTYRNDVKTAYNQTSNTKDKQALKNAFNGVNILLSDKTE